jgi:DNA-damage-inducible protein D
MFRNVIVMFRVEDIHARKKLEVGQKILDYMGSTELIANLFRISQTEEKLRKDNIQGTDLKNVLLLYAH